MFVATNMRRKRDKNKHLNINFLLLSKLYTASMGFFSSNFKKEFTVRTSEKAFASIMVAAACADGNVSEIEWERLIAFATLKKFLDYPELGEHLREALDICKSDGITTVIDASIPYIKESQKECLFLLCLELILADGRVTNTESSFITTLSQRLKIEDQRAKMFVEVIEIKNRDNVEIIG